MVAVTKAPDASALIDKDRGKNPSIGRRALAGEIMNRSGVTRVLIDLSMALVGRLKGGSVTSTS
ncbi:MAG: TRAP transporter large permease subunit [Kiloniellales bacterium]